MDTQIKVGDRQAIRRWATQLAVDYARQLWWKRFIGRDENSIVHEKIELKGAAGDTIQFDLSMRLRAKPVYGDDIAEGKEEGLKFLTDEIMIDQVRKPIGAGGRMTRQRTLHDLRAVAKKRGAEFMAEWQDEVFFVYASGDFGNSASNEDKLFEDGDFAANPVEAPDAAHIAYGGSATGKADLAAADKMSVAVIQKVNTKASMLNARNPDVVAMRPVKIESGEHFVTIMSPDQAHDLRTSTNPGDWLEIQKAAGQDGKQNPIFTGKMGMIDNVVLQKHAGVRRFSDYGAGGNVEAARALFLGRQAMTCAFGGGDGTRMTWEEELRDFKNNVAIAPGMIFGVKKTRYKPKSGGAGSDFGVIAIDTAAAPAY
jgi:N4-gp56 family major capsid protein